jgi:hypothetical protein
MQLKGDIPMVFKNEIERNQHEEAINRLCDEFPKQSDLIRKYYLENLESLIADASIRTYLPIFVSRKVRKHLDNLH